MVSTSYKDDQPDLSEALASWNDWNYDFWITAIELDDPLRISRPSHSFPSGPSWCPAAALRTP